MESDSEAWIVRLLRGIVQQLSIRKDLGKKVHRMKYNASKRAVCLLPYSGLFIKVPLFGDEVCYIKVGDPHSLYFRTQEGNSSAKVGHGRLLFLAPKKKGKTRRFSLEFTKLEKRAIGDLGRDNAFYVACLLDKHFGKDLWPR